MNSDEVLRLHPTPGEAIPLKNLYLDGPLEPADWGDRVFVYTNFVNSLDGRIALQDRAAGRPVVPDTIANPRDWRLFQELAARSDALIVSGRYLRDLEAGIAQDSLAISEKPEFADLIQWRQDRGMRPQPDVVVMSGSLDIRVPPEWFTQHRRVLVATTAAPDSPRARQLADAGAEIMHFTDTAGVPGRALIQRLEAMGYRRVYSIGGPYVHHTLAGDDMIDALYLTTVHRLVGGKDAPSIIEGGVFPLPVDLRLRWLYLDAHATPPQSLARYDRAR